MIELVYPGIFSSRDLSQKAGADAPGAPGTFIGRGRTEEAEMETQCPTCGSRIPVVPKRFLSAQLAEGAYSAYARSTGNKKFRGEEMPEWKDLPESIRTAWGAAVRFVFDQVA
jgi:hypothetical protein